MPATGLPNDVSSVRDASSLRRFIGACVTVAARAVSTNNASLLRRALDRIALGVDSLSPHTRSSIAGLDALLSAVRGMRNALTDRRAATVPLAELRRVVGGLGGTRG